MATNGNSYVVFDEDITATIMKVKEKEKICEIVGSHPLATVSFQTFVKKLLHSTKEEIETTYKKGHVLVLTDAPWENYEPVFSRTLNLHGQGQLVVAAASPFDSELLPLINLVRLFDRAPPLFETKDLTAGSRGYVQWNKTSFRCYPKLEYNPFHPYPCFQHSSDFTWKLWPVLDTWQDLTPRLTGKRRILLLTSVERKKSWLTSLLTKKGFQPLNNLFVRGETQVGFEFDLIGEYIDQLHVLDPPNNLAFAMRSITFQKRKRKVEVFLHVSYATPFEEPLDLARYRATLAVFLAQANLLEETMPPLQDIVAGLFVHHPFLHRDQLVCKVKSIVPAESKRTILETVDSIVATKKTVEDQFGTEGFIAKHKFEYFFNPLLKVERK